ncbi:hydroperoxide isomerase ALOXE3-like [Diretmus argenteus]
MAEYKVEVTTGDELDAGTMDYIYLSLIGSKGVSERKELDNYGVDFTAGQTATYTVKSNASLGKILLVKLEKDPFFLMDSDQWFCSKLRVTTPEKEVILFPCNRWVSTGEDVELRGGKDGAYLLLGCHTLTVSKKSLSSQKNCNAELKLKGLGESNEVWESVEAMKDIFWHYKTPISEHVIEHWEDDDFYGFQFLNSLNPNVIERCTELPSNFPVTEEMVKPFLKEGTTLAKEMVKGNIFICNYKRLDGIPTREEDGVTLPLTPGLCLLYVNPEKKLMPIAIQMLIPHLRFNLQINTRGRNSLFAEGGALTKTPLGKNGLIEVMAKHLSLITYSELCLPENIAARGLESIPNFYYRDDGLKVWDIVHSYVKGMVEQFYPSDNDVRKDTELQAWINDIFTNTFLGRKESEIPSSFKNVAELVKFLTFVVYTCSAQHSAVNNGQFDYYHWLLNGAILMRKPPPTVKGKATMKTILEMLPKVGDATWWSSAPPAPNIKSPLDL